MDNQFLQAIQTKVVEWRENKYRGVEKETLNILSYIIKVGYLHKPQIEALETYIYLKEIAGNKPTVEIVRSLFDNELDLIRSLGIDKEEALELAYDKDKDKKITELLHKKYHSIDYANQVYALTMGAGKTILMGVMMLYDFVLSYYHSSDERFAKNALVFAPDTTIIESLKEIKTFDYTRVLPKEYQTIVLNIKYHYLESTETALSPIGNYNIIVSNSQKIILKTRHSDNAKGRLFRDETYLKNKAIENRRLQAIRELHSLIIFVDEAHHSYGTTLEGTLKKTRETINFIHKEGKTPLTGVINLTGTPYINNKMISDVAYHFGLKQGIEQGILKQVRFFEYGNVKTESFIEDVVSQFLSEYKDRLEDRTPKIAFYASNIADLQQGLRPTLEAVLAKKKIPLDTIIEYHTEAEKNKDEFLRLDTPQSKKQFILLVGKGTEGWNCRSLVACALFRKPTSSIFVLQSSTRCLRAIGDNSTVASIFLSDENYRTLDKELKNNFATTIEELKNQDQESVENTLVVEKRKKVKVKKVLKEIVAVMEEETANIKIRWNDFKSDNYLSYVSASGILLNVEKKAEYQSKEIKREMREDSSLTFYEIVEIINRYTHLPCLIIKDILLSGLTKSELVKKINENLGLIPFIVKSVLNQAYKYEEKTETIEEELELTKLYPFKITTAKDSTTLIVYKKESDANRLGFHINPYNFDSMDEKDLFISLRGILRQNEAVADIYFTGGITDSSHNDFYFEYYSPENKRIARYFPDILVETTKNRYLVVEVKSTKAKLTYEENKKRYAGKIEELFDEVFAKEVGFKQFQQANKNFDYHLIFDAGLQNQQKELFERIKLL